MDDYPMQTAQVRMLKIVQERIEQAYEGGQLQARIDINQVIALGDELGISEGAAVAMFCRLGGVFENHRSEKLSLIELIN